MVGLALASGRLGRLIEVSCVKFAIVIGPRSSSGGALFGCYRPRPTVINQAPWVYLFEATLAAHERFVDFAGGISGKHAR
jgi:hypothetical protein